jgi:DNA ligase D-like protein (predicted polymerase)
MLIRKNTKAFKTIHQIVNACRDRPDREALIRLYITKAGDTVHERISVEAIQGGAGLFYEMNYQAVLENLTSSSHQLHHSDEIPGVYFFHSSSNKAWDETPFEFDEAIKKEFGALPDLPVLKKKGKAEKFVFPAPNVKAGHKPGGKKTPDNKKEKGESKKSARVVALWPKQPEYKLKHEIHFTGLERIAIRQAQLTKKDVLDYYHKIADHLLPWLADRPQLIRWRNDGQPGSGVMNAQDLEAGTSEELPDWIRTAEIGKGAAQSQLLLCNDKEHLLFYVQLGCPEFRAAHSRIKSLDSPDYIILAIESPDYELAKVVDVALAVREILAGLQLPSFVKTDGTSGLHIYIPLDSKAAFAISKHAAEYICKLVRLKIPDLVVLKGLAGHTYGKVSIDYTMNERAKAVVAPYSLVVGEGANVATPISWEEVKEGLTAQAFNHETIFQRLKEKGDLFKPLFRKKVNADTLVERMEENYSFLI